jgi:hypothetical protein
MKAILLSAYNGQINSDSEFIVRSDEKPDAEDDRDERRSLHLLRNINPLLTTALTVKYINFAP